MADPVLAERPPPSGPAPAAEPAPAGRWPAGEAEQPAGSPRAEDRACPAGEGEARAEGGAGPPPADGQRPEEAPQGPGCGGPRAPAGGEEEWRLRQLGKKKHRRRPSKKKRRWKPYSKLSWEEKQLLDERQSQRASRLRAEMFAKGQPVAPYNTTQFLMEDHDQEEPDLKTGLYPRKAAAKSDDTSEEDFLEEAADEDGGSDGMGGDGSEFLQRDFSETYERYHVESLQNMSKQELIKEYLELEKCLSRMEDENNRLRMESKTYGGDSAEDPRVRELELELDRLRAENLQLLKENELQRQPEKALPQLGE